MAESKDIFIIPHSGTEQIIIGDFVQLMKKHFEGHNIPRKVTVEEFTISYNRVKDYLEEQNRLFEKSI